MAKLMTAADLVAWAQSQPQTAGTERKYLFVTGQILTPGAIDAARGMGIELVYPGKGLRAVLRQIAEEVTGQRLTPEVLAEVEAQVLSRIKRE